jgi:type II secretory pathway component PulM
MDRVRELLADLNRYLAQLTARERVMLALAGVSVVVFVGSITWAQLARSINRHELAIEEKLQSLQQVAAYAQTFQETERTRRELELRLGGQPLKLVSHLQEITNRHGLTITSVNDRGEVALDQVREQVVDLEVRNMPIDKLAALLSEVERSPRIVKVKKLRVRRQGSDEKLVNVSLTVATYQLAKT